MSRLRVAPIVEGHGEQESIRTLLERIWMEVIGGDYIDVIRPIRQSKGALVNRPGVLESAVGLAAGKLSNPGLPDEPELILILVDADEDCPATLGPALLDRAVRARADRDICSIVAKKEFETWFVAGANSLSRYLDVDHANIPVDPESDGCGERWINRRFLGTRYSKTVDQPRMCSAFDLDSARSRSPSFDKLCRDLAKRLRRANEEVAPPD